MPDIDTADLRVKAGAARPGPWRKYESMQADTFVLVGDRGLLAEDVIAGPTYERANADYIAAASPDVMLALLDRLDAARRLIRDFTDPDPCWFDHHGGCQAHGYLSLKPGELCPHSEAKRDWLAAPRPLCPECTQGKCSNCVGQTLDDNDDWVPCGCPEHEGTS